MSTRELLILTGMSGAGRSTVAHALEDLGWYVVDNLQPALLPQLATQTTAVDLQSVAVVVDVRGGKFFDELSTSLTALRNDKVAFRLLFLDASDQIPGLTGAKRVNRRAIGSTDTDLVEIVTSASVKKFQLVTAIEHTVDHANR